ncbi:TetR/AcrR family transcriptional regulator [Actinacidiphila rubida]|uniref:Transcriptional regulator, TetR family n=1 Tax=Actinacidiphila rubida TaxID=310780 RepID=A0A1H8KN30_9ACTN|nr:TetR/AcrR family transcriptional regulator [Actinacidiphila rubida]SEN94227.1 transcriptional regulator, TetR family [Actinacidiphila rubida]
MTSKRTYDSPLRRESAARTRELILEAAIALFAARGYGRVTVADVAAEAGVAVKTVFASVGSKSDILDRIVDRAVAESGHTEAVRTLLGLEDPAVILRGLARGTRLGNERQFGVHEAIRKALPVHENGEALWRRATAAYAEALERVARHLHQVSGGAGPFTAEQTGDLLWFWFGPEGWRSLVVDRGWSWDQAEAALAATAVAALT